MAMDGNAIQAVMSNLKKARTYRALISWVLRAETTLHRISGMFYKPTIQIQTILLFGSETWNLTPPVVTQPEGFCVWALQSHKPCLDPEKDIWQYPTTTGIFERRLVCDTVGYCTCVRQETVTSFIGDRPIYNFYTKAER